MENTTDTTSATLGDVIELATWNAPRSLSDLRRFVSSHDSALDVEDFDI